MKPTQLSMLGSMEPFMRLQIDSHHLLVRLTHVLDWDLLQAVAEDRRLSQIKSARGSQPHFRANLGAVIVRSLKSSNLRETEDLCRNYMPARYMCDLQNSERSWLGLICQVGRKKYRNNQAADLESSATTRNALSA